MIPVAVYSMKSVESLPFVQVRVTSRVMVADIVCFAASLFECRLSATRFNSLRSDKSLDGGAFLRLADAKLQNICIHNHGCHAVCSKWAAML